MNEWNRSKFVSRKDKAVMWVSDGKPLTDFATKQHIKSLEERSSRSVGLVLWNQDEVTANVSKTSSPHASMNFVETFKSLQTVTH